MLIKLSSSRKILADQLFSELEKEEDHQQVILVPDRLMASWLRVEAALSHVFLLNVRIEDLSLFMTSAPSDASSFRLHLFGFRHVDSVLLDLSFRGHFTKVVGYFFSPSSHFWSDLLSERELGKQIAQTKKEARNQVQAVLEEFYLETNSLLSNAALFGRKGANFICDHLYEVEALYPVSQALLSEHTYKERMFDERLIVLQDAPLTLLRRLQADLIFLVGSRKEKEVLRHDSSLVVVEAPTLRSEVSGVVQEIERLSSQAPIGLGDILVLTLDPAKYEPVLSHLLPHLKVQSFHDDSIPFLSRLQSWFHLLNSRFDKQDLITLLMQPKMTTLLDCEEGELSELVSFLYSSSFSWGIDAGFRKKWLEEATILPKEESMKEGTVQALLEEKLFSLFDPPSGAMDLLSSKKELFRFLAFIHHIAGIWHLPFEKEKRFSLSSLCNQMGQFIEAGEALFSQDERYVLTEALSSLTSNKETDWSCQDFFEYLLKEVQNKMKQCPVALSSHVLVGHVLDTAPIPARYIAFLGMGEEEMRAFLRERSEQGGMASSTLVQEACQYAVIDAMMQAKEKVSFSYVSWNFELRQKKQPSPIVTLIENYVKQQFDLEETIHIEKRCLEWLSAPTIQSKEKKEETQSKNEVQPTSFASSMSLYQVTKILADPLVSYMKRRYGHRYHRGKKRLEPSLFSSTREMERLVEQDLYQDCLKDRPFISTHSDLAIKPVQMKTKRGISAKLVQKELHELTTLCKHNMGAFRQPGFLDVPLQGLDPFSKVSWMGNLRCFPPYSAIFVAEDLEKAILEGGWAKLALLSSLKDHCSQYGVEPTVLCPIQKSMKELIPIVRCDLERFFSEVEIYPFPFRIELLPALIGEKSSFSFFEELLEEELKEKNHLLATLSLLMPKEEREAAFPIWRERANQLIAPWIRWAGGKI